MNKRYWKKSCKEAERAAVHYRTEGVRLDRGVGECWEILRDDGCKACGLLPTVLRDWLRVRADQHDVDALDAAAERAEAVITEEMIQRVWDSPPTASPLVEIRAAIRAAVRG